MKKIYIILTHTGTGPSKIIKMYTKAKFSHVSISLDEELNEMYSFGRLTPYNALYSGFVHEGINFGTFKRFKNTEANIYSYEIEDYQYNKIASIIQEMKESTKRYKFNIIGLIAVAFNIRIKRKRAYYCAEFLKYLLEEADVRKDLPDIIKPEHFMNLKELKLIYNGKLRDYNRNIIAVENNI